MRAKLYRDWWYAVWTENGVTRRASLRTQDAEEAKRKLLDFQRDFRPERSSVGDIMEAYLADRQTQVVRHDRMADAWKALKPHFAHLRPDQISRDTCRAYAASRRLVTFRNRKLPVQDGTIIKELTVLRAGLRWHDKNTPAVFEMPSTPPPKERHLSREEYGRLLESAQITPHLYLFVTLALQTAARAEALLQLTWDRVDFDRGLIDLRNALGRRKGRAQVPMTETARIALLDAWKASLARVHVIEYAGGPVQSVKKAFGRACEKAGLEGVTPHVLRHTAAVWMAEGGATMPEIAGYLGHSDSRITERVYAKFSPTFLKKAATALEFTLDSSPRTK